jgi:hypothetical protein
MKTPQRNETFTTCTGTRKELKYAYPPNGPVPYARVVAASSVTDVQVAVLATGVQDDEAQQLAIQQAARLLDLLS